jgi:nucleoid DNA-binding protein
MNKGDLIRELAKVVSTKKEAEAALNTILETITKALKKGEQSNPDWFWDLQRDQEGRP